MKNSKYALFSAAFVAALLVSLPASANIISISGAIGGAPAYANRLNFDDAGLVNGGTATQPSGSAVVSFDGANAGLVSGASSGLFAAPWLSGGNGLGFGLGGSNQPDGVDTTNYLTSGVGPGVTITFSAPMQYFGLLWGSVDTYNTLTFYNGNILVGSVTGSQVKLSPNGDQGEQGTVYVNINADPFTRVVATSTSYAFEFDNVSYNTTPIPDGGMTLMLLGGALVGIGTLRRKLGR